MIYFQSVLKKRLLTQEGQKRRGEPGGEKYDWTGKLHCTISCGWSISCTGHISHNYVKIVIAFNITLLGGTLP